MNYINLLCIDERDVLEDIWLLALPIISWFLLIFGVIFMCTYFGKKDKKSKRKCRIGIISLLLFTSLIFLFSLIISNVNTGSCTGYGPIISLVRNVSKIIQIIVPLVYIVKSIVLCFKFLFSKNNLNREELKRKIIISISIAFLIFIIITITTACIQFPSHEEEVVWNSCWCS